MKPPHDTYYLFPMLPRNKPPSLSCCPAITVVLPRTHGRVAPHLRSCFPAIAVTPVDTPPGTPRIAPHFCEKSKLDDDYGGYYGDYGGGYHDGDFGDFEDYENDLRLGGGGGAGSAGEGSSDGEGSGVGGGGDVPVPKLNPLSGEEDEITIVKSGGGAGAGVGAASGADVGAMEGEQEGLIKQPEAEQKSAPFKVRRDDDNNIKYFLFGWQKRCQCSYLVFVFL